MSLRIVVRVAGMMTTLLLCGVPDLARAAAPKAIPRAEDYAFAFRNADIQQVVEEVLGQAGVPFTIDPAVSGKISFRIEDRLTREQLVAALEQALAASGIAVVRNGEQLIITPQARAKSAAGIRESGRGVSGAGYELVAVPLAYAQPSEVSKALEAIAGADTVVYASDKLGLLLIGGTGSQLRSALETVKMFDQNSFQDARIRWMELSQAQATTVALEVDQILQAAGLSGVSVVPLRRLNGVIVFSRSIDALDQVSRWVLRLDTPGKEVNSSLWVYRPRNTSAESLAQTINSVMGVQTRVESTAAPTPPTSPVAVPAPAQARVVSTTTSGTSFGAGDDEVRVGVDKETNTLLVYAAPAKWVQIQRILSEIDRPERQIFIEASILEVTLGKEFSAGVDWRVFSRDATTAQVNNVTGVVQPTFPGLNITFINNNIEAAIKALGSKTSVEVVSAPKILALDNHTAHLQIGDQVPIIVQSSQSTLTPNSPLVNTVDYRSTGVILNVTPRITGEDQLTLEVSQEVSAVSPTQTSGIDSPTIQQRKFESVLVLHDGGVVALGGLISSNRTFTQTGVPGFKDVPLLGSLFRAEDHNVTRTELIVLLTARIVKDVATSDRALADLARDMKELQARGLLHLQK